MQKISFLNPGITQIRHSIRGILDSYNNPWDILAELLQNSVDAIRQRENSEEQGKIKITIDCSKKLISVQDNGIGINPSDLPILLKPFSTNKHGWANTIGEKGVGLKFVIFSSGDFYIETKNKIGATRARITDARQWVEGNTAEELMLHFNEISDTEKYNEFEFGTLVQVTDIINNHLFELTIPQIKFVLRTCTAIGDTSIIWNEHDSIKVTLNYTNPDGILTENISVENRYFLPPEDKRINPADTISLEEFILWERADSRTDAEKRNKLKNKIIYSKGQSENGNRTIGHFAYYVPSRKLWNKLSMDFGLCSSEETEDDDWLDNFSFTRLNSGIYLSTKGMPTGISIKNPTTGYAGYWSNIFMIFNDNSLKFDIGRKTIDERQTRAHKQRAKEVFNEFIKYISKYASGDVSPDTSVIWDRDEVFAEIDEIMNLDIPWLKFQKSPLDQEASIAAIFYECIGNQRIKNIVPLISGYKNRYDLYAKWGARKVVIEFKSSLSNILKDFVDVTKIPSEINCIVCWDINDTEVQKFYDKGITISKIRISSLMGGQENFPHATHTMQVASFGNPVYIIDLKLFLESEL